MKKIFFLFLCFFFGIFSCVHAEEDSMDIPQITPQVTPTNSGLLLDTIKVNESQKLTLTFNQEVQLSTVRVRVTDQATNETIKVASITGTTMPQIVAVLLNSPLQSGNSYVLTITSALSKNNDPIKAGIDSIREFSVPADVGVALNAPPNPSAVLVATGTALSQSGTSKKTSTGMTSVAIKQKVQALPATGVSQFSLILFAALGALMLLVIRQKKA